MPHQSAAAEQVPDVTARVLRQGSCVLVLVRAPPRQRAESHIVEHVGNVALDQQEHYSNKVLDRVRVLGYIPAH